MKKTVQTFLLIAVVMVGAVFATPVDSMTDAEVVQALHSDAVALSRCKRPDAATMALIRESDQLRKVAVSHIGSGYVPSDEDGRAAKQFDDVTNGKNGTLEGFEFYKNSNYLEKLGTLLEGK